MKSITILEKVFNHQLHLNVPDEFNNKKVTVVITTDENEYSNKVSEPNAEYLIKLKPEERKKYLQHAAEEAKKYYSNSNRNEFQSGDFSNY